MVGYLPAMSVVPTTRMGSQTIVPEVISTEACFNSRYYIYKKANSGKTERIRRLARAFVVRACDKYPLHIGKIVFTGFGCSFTTFHIAVQSDTE